MIEERITALQSTIETARNIPSERKAELVELITELKSEVRRLAETHQEEASSITRFADASAHEAARAEQNPQLTDTALQGLRLSIRGLEESHPEIVGIVSRFATALSNMGL
jgi:chromosome segregation ATPase